MANPVLGLHRSADDWKAILPSTNYLIARSAAAAAIIIGNLALLAWVGWKFYPTIAKLNEVKLINTLLWPSVIISFGAWRIWAKGKDAPFGLNERTARLYEGAQVILMLPAAILLFPTYLASRLDRTDFSNRTVVSSISTELRTREFEDIASHYQKDRHSIDRFVDKYQRSYTNLFDIFIKTDGRVSNFEQGTILLGENGAGVTALRKVEGETITVKKWMDKAFPLMTKLKRELKRHKAEAVKNPGKGAIKDKTEALENAIRFLNTQWKEEIAPLCYNADLQVRDSSERGILTDIFLRSTGRMEPNPSPIAPAPVVLEEVHV